MNIEKHGIAFDDAVRIFEGPTLDQIDRRKDYGEVRINSLGAMGDRIVANVTHTGRDGQTRLISARLANDAERRAYRMFQMSLSTGSI